MPFIHVKDVVSSRLSNHQTVKKALYPMMLTTVFVAISGCHSVTQDERKTANNAHDVIQQHSTALVYNNQPMFTAAHRDIKLETVSRRKWDNAVVADFDNDGFQDLLLTDHGFSVKLYWNNKGKYGKGYDLIVGDMHGIGVADYNNDGKVDVLISRGGGSGSNARNAKLYHFDGRNIIEGNEFEPPLQNLRGRTSKFFDANNNGDLDLLLMGFPQRNAGSQTANFVYKNDGKGNISGAVDLPQTFMDGQKVLITDFNNDNIDDLLIYGNASVIALQGNGDLSFTDVTDTVLGKKYKHVTGIAEIDFDNDGDFDLYLTTATPLEAGDTFFDKPTSSFGFYTKRGSFQFDDLVLGEVFDLQNYQAPYPHQNIYIGEGAYQYQTEGELHSGQNVKLVSSNALGWPDKLPNKGLYVGYIGNDTWRIAGNTFSPTTGVIKDVQKLATNKYQAEFTNKAEPVDILLENQNGKFVDASAPSNIKLEQHNSSIAVADFNNSGYQDLFIVQQGNLARSTVQAIWLNQGNGSFELAKHHGVVSNEIGALGAGANALDYNNDGAMDLVYANERGLWHLFKNNGLKGTNTSSNGNYIVVSIDNSPSGRATAQGALVKLTACGQSQYRRVGASGAAYTQSFNKQVHFGLGNCKAIETVYVRWSNNEVYSIENAKVNSINQMVFDKKYINNKE
ncbi:CRTAC1 family protein [Shewanella donghaensis]|uniref:CRTAC1 family protein n=1 Tax=Shewanella donghaensis TaxID=238836 RepID=UPI001D043E60|nr:CRTAC1 family protein [Shewanella donghaensis]